MRESSAPLVMRTCRAATANYRSACAGLPSLRNVLTSGRSPPAIPATPAGIACGAGAALFWAAGFVAARHGIAVGFSPADIVLHRFIWAGLLCLPLVVRAGLGDLAGVG